MSCEYEGICWEFAIIGLLAINNPAQINRGRTHATASESLSDHFVDGEDFPENLTSVSQFHMVGRGQAPNFLITIVHRILINGDGTLKFEFQHVTGTCSG